MRASKLLRPPTEYTSYGKNEAQGSNANQKEVFMESISIIQREDGFVNLCIEDKEKGQVVLTISKEYWQFIEKALHFILELIGERFSIQQANGVVYIQDRETNKVIATISRDCWNALKGIKRVDASMAYPW